MDRAKYELARSMILSEELRKIEVTSPRGRTLPARGGHDCAPPAPFAQGVGAPSQPEPFAVDRFATVFDAAFAAVFATAAFFATDFFAARFCFNRTCRPDPCPVVSR